MRGDRERLAELLAFVDDVHRYACPGSGRSVFDQNELVRIRVRHHILLIGEAVARVSDELKSRHPEVPWRLIADMRNRLVHGYDQIDDGIVWETVDRDLPSLRRQIDRILNELP